MKVHRQLNRVVVKPGKNNKNGGEVKLTTEQKLKMTIHHRRPTSIGGARVSWNTSIISEEEHKAWTTLTGNMNAEQIAHFITNTIEINPRKIKLRCVFINGKRCKMRGKRGTSKITNIVQAWNTLFKNIPNFKEKIEEINNRLLDPSYHLYIW